jgi:hypothetical protein
VVRGVEKELNLSEMKRITDQATPGPWHYDSGNGDVESRDPTHYRASVADRPGISDTLDHYRDFALTVKPIDPSMNMEFIAMARSAMPKLIAVAEAAKVGPCRHSSSNQGGVDCDLCRAIQELEK